MRNAEFDREEVLRAAIRAFIARGYTKTSMQDLKAATGLHPGSIYCAFESKKGLMLAAIEQYDKDKAEEFQTLFAGKGKVVDGIREYLQRTVTDVTSSNPGCQKACLNQKALSELSDNEPEIEASLRQSINHWKNGFTEVFEQALANGEVGSERTPEQRMQSLVIGIFGIRTFAQTQQDEDALNQLARQLFEDVCR